MKYYQTTWFKGCFFALVCFLGILFLRYGIKTHHTFGYFSLFSLSLLLPIFWQSLQKSAIHLDTLGFFKTNMRVGLWFSLVFTLGVFIFLTYIEPNFLTHKFSQNLQYAQSYIASQEIDNKDFVLENIKKNMEMMFRVKTSILFVFLANITLSTIDSLVLAIFFRIFFANYLRGLKKNT